MSDFDREFAKSIGIYVSQTGLINRELVASCYYDVLRKLNIEEPTQVTEKWIDYLTERLSELIIKGKDSAQIAKSVFEKIAKT